MKTILVPTDFSDPANNAVEYALYFAQKNSARIILNYAYNVPVPTSETPVMVVSDEELQYENLNRLKQYKQTMLNKTGTDVQVECVVSSGFAADEIHDLAKDQRPDLIVMGIANDGKVGHLLLGSVTTSLLNRINIPLLIVPLGAHFTPFEKIALACDYKNPLNQKVLKELKTFVRMFRSDLFVIHVHPSGEKVNMAEAVTGLKLEDQLEGLRHTLHFPDGTDPVSGINEFDDDHKIDLLIMIPHKHSMLERIFKGSVTRKMVFHAHVPILALHD